MGLFDSLFGGSSQSSQSTQQSTSQAGSFLDPTQQRRHNAITGGFLPRIQQGALLPGGTGDLGQQLAPQLGQAGLGLIGQSVGPQAAQAQIGSLTDILNRNQELGLNSIQNRFGQSGSIGSRAGVAGGQLLEGTQLALGQGTAQILGQQSQLGLEGAAGLQGQFDLATGGLNPLIQAGLDSSGILGTPQILNQATSQSSGTASGGGSSTPGIFGNVGLNFLMGG